MNTSRITQKTGIDTDTSQIIDFVKAPIEDIVNVLGNLVLTEVQRDIYGKRILVNDLGYLLYQIENNEWTAIEHISAGYSQIARYIPEIANILGVKTVHYEYNDTTEFMNYVCFDRKSVVESYISDDVSRQDSKEEEEEFDLVAHVDSLLKAQGIYVLCGEWSGHFACAGSWLNISDPIAFYEDFSGFHYLILLGLSDN